MAHLILDWYGKLEWFTVTICILVFCCDQAMFACCFCVDRLSAYIISHFHLLCNIPKTKESGHPPAIPAILPLLPAPEHITHIHCRLFQHLVSYVRVDVRRGLVVRVADDLHRDQWTKKGGRLYNTIRLPPTYPVLLLFCQPQILIHSRPRDPYAMRITPSFVIFSPIRIVILQAKKRLRIFSLTIS